uniref:DDE Tnp4 domain-containing protein n=1 Tax=Electrophorus electricus TaxID=8005 RepID=A0A4W4FGG4_ELEEL
MTDIYANYIVHRLLDFLYITVYTKPSCLHRSHTRFKRLVRLLPSCDWAGSTLEGWTMMHAVLSSLWTLSTLESHASIAARFQTSESLIHQQLQEFCALVTANFSDKVHWPKWKDAEASVAGFSAAVGLPGTVCAVGYCLIPIERPMDVPDSEAYRVSERSYLVNLMAFCNHQGCFTYVSAKHPGNWHNSRVLLDTEVGRALQQDPVSLLRGKHIIGDSTFPLSEHLLTPFPDHGTLGEKKRRYNLKVQAALQVVRGSLHSLRCRFQRLKLLQMNSVAQTSLAVHTCCILYNMYLETNNAASLECMEEDFITQMPFHELPTGHSGSLGGISKRQDVAASLGRKPKKDGGLKHEQLQQLGKYW